MEAKILKGMILKCGQIEIFGYMNLIVFIGLGIDYIILILREYFRYPLNALNFNHCTKKSRTLNFHPTARMDVWLKNATVFNREYIENLSCTVH